jgi:phosphate transport system protein
MGGLVLDQLHEAARAYADWNEGTAQRVIDRDAAVKAYDTGIAEDELTILARRAPVASDLRAIIALAKCVAELERVGSEARKIARAVLQQAGRPGKRSSVDVRHLAQLACSQVRKALDSLDRLDVQLAGEVIAGDDELDIEYTTGLRRLLTRAMEDPRSIEGAVETAFALRSLERIGDHASNIARYVQAMGPQAGSPDTPGSQMLLPENGAAPADRTAGGEGVAGDPAL